MFSQKIFLSLKTAFVSVKVKTQMECCLVLAFDQGLQCLHFIEVFTVY